jgi:hypothetical protein
MLLCLSSGSSRRYREDILRAAGLPFGSLLRFRYDQKYLGQNLISDIATSKLIGSRALVVYSDQAAKDKQPTFLPCRYAKVQAAEQVGTTISIDLKLEDFAFAKDVDSFKNEIDGLSASQTPKRKLDGSIEGLYCVALNAEPKAVTESSDEEKWEFFISQIAARSDFAGNDAFVLIRGIYSVDGSLVKPDNSGEYRLRGSSMYTLRFYQYHPSRTPAGDHIKVTASSERIAFISNPVLTLDSRYDHKDLRFEISPGLDRSHSFIQVALEKKNDPDAEIVFDLTYDVPFPFWRTLGMIALTASLLAAPTLAAAAVNAALSHRRFLFVALVSVLSSIVVALLATFKLRRLV